MKIKIKVVCSTSDNYLHIVPIFIHLFQKYWGSDQQVEIVGYKKPDIELPSNFTFFSHGEQIGDSKNFGTDLRKYFEQQDQYIIWLMEDTFLRDTVNKESLDYAERLIRLHNAQVDVMRNRLESTKKIGRVALTNQNLNQYTEKFNGVMDATAERSEYRLSTMPAIWNKDFLLLYLQQNMNPWEFECQDKVDDKFLNIAFSDRDVAPIKHNEGTRRFDIHKMNFEGIDPQVLDEMKQKGII